MEETLDRIRKILFTALKRNCEVLNTDFNTLDKILKKNAKSMAKECNDIESAISNLKETVEEEIKVSTCECATCQLINITKITAISVMLLILNKEVKNDEELPLKLINTIAYSLATLSMHIKDISAISYAAGIAAACGWDRGDTEDINRDSMH